MKLKSKPLSLIAKLLGAVIAVGALALKAAAYRRGLEEARQRAGHGAGSVL